MKAMVILIVVGVLGIVTKKINKGTEGLGNKWMSRDYSNYSIVEIGQNTEKSPGDLSFSCCLFIKEQRPIDLSNLTVMKSLQTSDIFWRQIWLFKQDREIV